MKRFFTKIIRFFWSWGFLKFVLGLIALLILLYIEEDWRGAHAWAVTKAKWAAAGESFDPNTYYPKPIPDDQNLAALPIFALEPDPENSRMLSPLKLKDALNTEKHGGELPKTSNSFDEIRAKIATAYAKAFPGTTPPADTLAQFEALYPLVPEIRAAAATRPLCRFNQDYSTPTLFRGLSLITEPISVSQKFALHAIIAMNENQPGVAMDDFRINFRFAAATGRDPTLVGGLVDIGIVSITRGVVDDLIQKHAFTDAELVELQGELTQFDFLAQYEFSMRGEIVTGTVPMFAFIKKTSIRSGLGLPMYGLFPAGWLDFDAVHTIDFLFRELACVDLKSRRVSPAIPRELDSETERAMETPWNFYFNLAIGPLSNAARTFFEAQVHLDQDQIACALERYHLGHGVYPNTLDELAPAYIAALPHDIINGEAYHYRLQPSGTFLLYSVGWNQTDDGGKVVYQAGSKTVNYEEGDWPWPTSK